MVADTHDWTALDASGLGRRQRTRREEWSKLPCELPATSYVLFTSLRQRQEACNNNKRLVLSTLATDEQPNSSVTSTLLALHPSSSPQVSQ